jgi:hypothetical protein
MGPRFLLRSIRESSSIAQPAAWSHISTTPYPFWVIQKPIFSIFYACSIALVGQISRCVIFIRLEPLLLGPAVSSYLVSGTSSCVCQADWGLCGRLGSSFIAVNSFGWLLNSLE